MRNMNNNYQNRKRQHKLNYKVKNTLVKPLKENQYLNVKSALRHRNKGQVVKRIKVLSKSNKGLYYESVIYEIEDVL